METPLDVYNAYRIMPALALHQLRVAAVGQRLCEVVQKPVDSHAVVLTCLFHDMGNIIKSDLSTFPEFSEPEGVPYWEGVKQEFVQKYGTNEHEATLSIVREIGLSPRVLEYIGGIGFSKLEETRDTPSYEQKICEYADLRVSPYGVTSLEERLREARARYLKRKDSEMTRVDDRFEELLEAGREVERQLFAGASVGPDAIIEESIQPLMEKLRSYSL